MTVAPLTATVLADADGSNAGIASGVTGATQDAAVTAFHGAMGISAALVALGGVLGLAGIVNERRHVDAEGCSDGQIAGVPEDVAACFEAGEEPVPAAAEP